MSKLLDEVRNKLRVHHYAMKTEKSFVQWIKRFIIFHKKRHPADIANQGTVDLNGFRPGFWRFNGLPDSDSKVSINFSLPRGLLVFAELWGLSKLSPDSGKQLDKAKESFGTAMGQLYTGKGNLIGQAKEFEKLGVSVQTPLPDHLVAKAALELEHLPATADGTELETTQS